MNRFLKLAAIPIVTFAATIPMAHAAQAGEHAGTIVVTSASEMERWQSNATRRLNRALDRDPTARSATPSPGIVQVAFTLDADGRPANVELLGNSSDRVAARSAKLAVRRMGDLSDVPVTNPDEVRFLANVIFANDRAERRELAERLAQSERARIASGGAPQAYIVLGG